MSLKLISCVPNNPQFLWETANNLTNQRKFGTSASAQVLVFLTYTGIRWGFDSRWKNLELKFPEVKFFYYKDLDNIETHIRAFQYIPLLRPYMLYQHWENFPDLKNSTIYYHDSDTVFTWFPKFLEMFGEDNINYLSDTKSYLNSDYFENKKKDLLPEKIEEYSEIDVLSEMAQKIGITKQHFLDNKDNTGGAQYLLKNIDSSFWKDVFFDSLTIRTYLIDINKRFFASEEAGFQSWCADMWAVIGNLWKRNRKVITPKEMDFCFATDWISQWNKKTIYHDANGFPEPFEKEGKIYRTFWKKGPKNTYIKAWEDEDLTMPFYDDLSYVSPELCSYNYVQQLLETKNYILK